MRKDQLTGSFWMLLSALMFSLQLTILKAASLTIHPLELVFLRNGMALIPLSIMALYYRPLLPDRTRLLLLRCILGVTAAAALYSANSLAPLALVALLFNARIFPLSYIAALALREQISLRRIGLISFGFLGLTIATLPPLETHNIEMGIIFAATAALLSAGSQISVKALTAKNSPLAVSLYSQVGLFILSIPLAIAVWTTPTIAELFLVAAAAFFGGFAALAAAHALKLTSATVVSPIDSTSIVFSALLGFLFFGEVLNWVQMLGIGIVIVASYAIARWT